MNRQPHILVIVLVQGAFQLPLIYIKLAQALEVLGYHVPHPTIPSLTGQDDPDLATNSLADYADTIRGVLEHLTKKMGKTVVVLMHSYGGSVGTEAVPRSLSRLHRKVQGLPRGVAHLIYVAGFITPQGQIHSRAHLTSYQTTM
ncbi:hypothetical protein TruAng_001613 [Truncatella angustata]|nr:hypothetical protein TruAng_001613 [Truncatella angustata]